MIDTSKVIHAPVGGGRYTVTAPIVKEDYGLYLLIEGLELPSTYEVDFSNSEHNGTSVTMIGNADGVLIPSQFISSGKDVFAFLYHVGEDYGRTVFKFRIPNKCRPDRTNEQPTPEQQSVIDQAISALNSAVEQTAQDVIDADASAQSASADADRAEQAKEDASTFAQRSANSAQASADYSASAQASATASAQSASQSAQIKADVEDLVDDAQGYANSAQQSASDADQSARESAESARASGESALSASNSALSSGEYASNALGHAESASTSAQTASQKATEAAQSATNASRSAQTAESAKTASQTAQGLAESARDLAQGYAEDAQGYANDAQASAEGISASASQIAQNTANILKAFPTDTASGAVASFTDGADNIPLKSLIVNIDPVQDTSSGDPSPENICPISGWTGCEVSATGKNLLALPVIRFFEGTATVDNCFYLKQGTYTLSYSCADTHRMGVRMMDANGTIYTNYSDSPLSGFAYNSSAKCYYAGVNLASGSKTFTMTIKHDCYVRIVSNLNGGGFTDVQLEIGDTATEYEPYNGTTIPISWQTEAGTVYGGKLDVLSGKLTVYPYYASYNGETLTGRWISDRDVYAVGTTPTIGAQVVDMSGTGTEVQLEAHEIASLLGANNLWADTGDVAVEYRADTKLYIDRLTEPDADMIADSNITSGSYFMVGNNLFRATANIASGGQVIVGTNCARKSLSEALNEINS